MDESENFDNISSRQPLINLDEILAPAPNENELSREQISKRTVERFIPYVSPLVTSEEVISVLANSRNQNEAEVRTQITDGLIEDMAYFGAIAPSPATFDSEAALALNGNPRALEVAIELGLVQKVEESGRFMLTEDAYNLFNHMLT